MAILSKGCKPDNFELHNFLKVSFTNIRGLRSNFFDRESFLDSNSPDILALFETNLDGSIDSGNFSVRGYLEGFSYSYAWSRSLCEGRTYFARALSPENSANSYLFSTSFTSLCVLLLFPQSITFFVFMQGF